MPLIMYFPRGSKCYAYVYVNFKQITIVTWAYKLSDMTPLFPYTRQPEPD